MKLIVLSDLHLTPPGETVLGIDPWERLDAAIERINAAYGDADLVALAGDLTDLGRTAAYTELRARLEQLVPPWAATLGNHDNREVFARVFGADVLDPDGYAQSAHDLGDFRVLLLDTLEKGPSRFGGWGHSHGWLCDARLDWLTAQLDGRPAVIVQHHAATPIGIHMDELSLKSPERLWARLADRNVRAVIAGHVHMASATVLDGVTYVTLAGGHTTSRERLGSGQERGKERFTGAAQMAVVLSEGPRLSVHFESYHDAHPELRR